MPDVNYIHPPIETDPAILAQNAFDWLAGVVPDWEPHNGNFEVWMIEALARIAAEVRDVASAVPTAIFKYAGATLFGLPPVEAAPASISSTWEMVDNSGYTIPLGTLVGLRTAGDQLIPFEVGADVVVIPGDTTTDAGEVLLIAVDPGEAANDLAGPANLIDALTFVQSIALIDETVGGTDAEDDVTYLNRLVDELSLMSPRPILPSDFEVLARRIAGVHRAFALDLYNPVDDSDDNERMVTVAAIDEEGNAVSSAVKNQIDALLEAMREVNFIVNVMDPTHTAIGVTFTAVCHRLNDPVTVEAAAEAAVTEYLKPKNWGLPPGDNPTAWENKTIVRYLEVAEVLQRVDGLDYITALALTGGTASGTDRILPGRIPLPNPGAVAGTVNAP